MIALCSIGPTHSFMVCCPFVEHNFFIAFPRRVLKHSEMTSRLVNFWSISWSSYHVLELFHSLAHYKISSKFFRIVSER